MRAIISLNFQGIINNRSNITSIFIVKSFLIIIILNKLLINEKLLVWILNLVKSIFSKNYPLNIL